MAVESRDSDLYLDLEPSRQEGKSPEQRLRQHLPFSAKQVMLRALQSPLSSASTEWEKCWGRQRYRDGKPSAEALKVCKLEEETSQGRGPGRFLLLLLSAVSRKQLQTVCVPWLWLHSSPTSLLGTTQTPGNTIKTNIPQF